MLYLRYPHPMVNVPGAGLFHFWTRVSGKLFFDSMLRLKKPRLIGCTGRETHSIPVLNTSLGIVVVDQTYK